MFVKQCILGENKAICKRAEAKGCDGKRKSLRWGLQVEVGSLAWSWRNSRVDWMEDGEDRSALFWCTRLPVKHSLVLHKLFHYLKLSG